MRVLHQAMVRVYVADIECDCGKKIHLSQMSGLDDMIACECGKTWGMNDYGEVGLINEVNP